MEIRTARHDDLAALVDIYNHYVQTSHATFDVGAFTVQARSDWFELFDGARYQCWVADEGTGLLGYACSIPFKPKKAYQTSVEVSVYVAARALGRGIGAALYERLLPALEAEDLHRAYAGIAQPNQASMNLHYAQGFEKAAHFHEVGRKFDRYWDVVWLERKL